MNFTEKYFVFHVELENIASFLEISVQMLPRKFYLFVINSTCQRQCQNILQYLTPSHPLILLIF